MNDTQKNYNILLEAIETNNISAEDLLNAFTDWNGLQLIDDDFIEFLNMNKLYIKLLKNNKGVVRNEKQREVCKRDYGNCL